MRQYMPIIRDRLAENGKIVWGRSVYAWFLKLSVVRGRCEPAAGIYGVWGGCSRHNLILCRRSLIRYAVCAGPPLVFTFGCSSIYIIGIDHLLKMLFIHRGRLAGGRRAISLFFMMWYDDDDDRRNDLPIYCEISTRMSYVCRLRVSRVILCAWVEKT